MVSRKKTSFVAKSTGWSEHSQQRFPFNIIPAYTGLARRLMLAHCSERLEHREMSRRPQSRAKDQSRKESKIVGW